MVAQPSFETMIPTDGVPELSNPLERQLHAVPFMHDYDVAVLNRESLHEPETTLSGATIYNELVSFGITDGPEANMGRLIVREATIAVPNPKLVNASPHAWTETDPWTTGVQGFNRDKINHYAALGYPVVWLHHAGKYSPVAADKSVGHSAYQMHVYLDELKESADFDTEEVLLGGYSRGAMTAEKFIILAKPFGRTVSYSDTEAPCFSEDMSTREKIMALITQLPSEGIGLLTVAVKLTEEAIEHNDLGKLTDYLATLDPHPRNVIQEILWAKALINSNVGKSVELLPVDTQGFRTFYSKDVMSQRRKFEKLYARLPGITVSTVEGPHVAGAYPENLQTKYNRMAHVLDIMHQSGDTLTGADISGLQPEPSRRTKHPWVPHLPGHQHYTVVS